MFYGLNNIFKNLFPKRLFYRSLLIVATPIIILQLIITIVFFDSLWIKTNKGMTRALVGEMKTFIVAFDNGKYNNNDLSGLFSIYLDLNVDYKDEEFSIKKQKKRWFSPIDRNLRRELKTKIGSGNYWFDTTAYKELIHISIKHGEGYFEFFIPKDRVSNTSARVFGLWITVPAFLLITIAIIFLKNQTKPILNLAKAAERFGRGEDIDEYRPSGALEIRKAGFEFDKMRKRIKKHLNQRSEMLSGISHDLRTPLTRLKLQLALMKDDDLSKKMSLNIDEMEKMLNDYLQFAKTQAQEDTSAINLSSLFNEIKNDLKNENLIFNNLEDTILKGRFSALKRCFENVIQNGLTYGKTVYVDIQKGSKRVVININDDGPGIPEDQYKNVFKPFIRLDKSRSLNLSGVGLGLAIVEDIINSHGGSIQLGRNKYNGLQVKISLPF